MAKIFNTSCKKLEKKMLKLIFKLFIIKINKFLTRDFNILESSRFRKKSVYKRWITRFKVICKVSTPLTV